LYTHGHTTRVTNLSLAIAEKLKLKNKKVVSERFLEHLHMASLLHDIGKIGVPEHILNKKGDLTIGERNRIKEHPIIGATILQPLRELDLPMLGVKHHHERFDGAGYPDGLKGQEIPLIASIISVADTFDAMTTDRPYRLRLSKVDAVNEIKRVSGKQLDPYITSTFVELCQENKV
ncbi:MAG: HD domain-containing protein, partial [Candidatus Omnitrophica bacterium]|nr:HD domain-containing protein [Candidatus Omnitrophota bacterium]